MLGEKKNISNFKIYSPDVSTQTQVQMLSFDLQGVDFSFIVVKSTPRSSDGLHLRDLVVSGLR